MEWWFLGQTHNPAERVINADPHAWYSTPSPELVGPENHADKWAGVRDPDVVHAMAEDCRAGLGIDRYDVSTLFGRWPLLSPC